MSPKQLVEKWVEAFNAADTTVLSDLYAEHAVNFQVPNEPIEGRTAIMEMFEREFAAADMVCQPVNLFEDGQWAILEWTDPLGMRGCGFFQVENDRIVFQRGYWDKLSFHSLYSISVPE